MDIEKRSIEFIPSEERYGTPRRLFTLWFSVNVQISALIIGALGVVAGLNIFWALVALVCGTAIGAIFMAGHSAQGPHLGIPQMIQSRAQFGVYGAALPLVIMVVSYVLFTAANCVMIRSSVQAAVPISDNTAIVTFSAISLFIAFVGYELIHRVAIWMSVASLLLFVLAGCFALAHPFPAGAWAPVASGFNLHGFMIGLMGAASWSIGFAPFVADYSRYLPQNVRTSHTFWYSYAGQFFGAVLVMTVGAILGSLSYHAVDDAGNTVAAQFPYGRWLAYLLIVLGVLESNVMNVYSTYMSATTIFTGFNGAVRIARAHKLLIMTAASCLAAGIAVATQYHFADYFSDILIIQLYICVPWTAINLCDFYYVRRGKYSVPDIYLANGQYGRFNAGTIFVFAVSLVAQIPFMQLSFYVGPVARYFGTDVTMLISIILPSVLYLYINRVLVRESRQRSVPIPTQQTQPSVH
jgi:NCS1 family nucleobase:cation symporter-1